MVKTVSNTGGTSLIPGWVTRMLQDMAKKKVLVTRKKNCLNCQRLKAGGEGDDVENEMVG